MTEEEFLELFETAFGPNGWPRAVRILEGIQRVNRGESVGAAATAVNTTPRRLQAVLDSDERIKAAIGAGPGDVTDENRQRATKILGQMLVGRCAEILFERRYRSELGTEELALQDTREGGTDTDYRLVNGQGRKVFRINIKFHGAQFKRAAEMVGLEPLDCFALATYKIKSALEKQDDEGMPYFFAIIGVPGLTAASVGSQLPAALIEALALVLRAGASPQKPFEDRLIDYAVAAVLPIFRETYARIEAADWYVLSARRAHELLKEKLFQRVYALRVKNFTRAFGRAEVDMHFSLSEDLIPLSTFFQVLKEGGLAKVSALLERGDL